MNIGGIVCFGDSNTYGFDPRSFLGGRYEAEERWTESLGKALGCRAVNLGLNGRCMPAGKEPVLEKLINENPELDTLIIMLGTNDLLSGLEPEAVGKKAESFIAELKKLRPLNIILLSPPKAEPETGISDKLKELSEIYKAAAEKYSVYFCDSGKWPAELCFDGIHLSEKGNRSFSEKLLEFLRKI